MSQPLSISEPKLSSHSHHLCHNPPTAESPPPIPSGTHLDRTSYLFGYPISHSLSPLLHSTVYSALGLNYQFLLYETRSIQSCLALTQSPQFFGASVTMPHKVSIIPYLDLLSPEAAAIGAINTIVPRPSPVDGRRRLLYGTNTDCIGIRESILRNVDPAIVAAMRGQPGMVIGGGGTSRAAVYALKTFLGCSEIYLVNRDPSEVDLVIQECTSKGFGDGLRYLSSAVEAESLPAPRVIVSAIPDFPPQSEQERRTRRVIEVMLAKDEKGAVLDMCYHPSLETAIVSMSRKAGWQVVDGVEALIWGALEQDKVWFERDLDTLPVEKVREVIYAKMKKSNL